MVKVLRLACSIFLLVLSFGNLMTQIEALLPVVVSKSNSSIGRSYRLNNSSNKIVLTTTTKTRAPTSFIRPDLALSQLGGFSIFMTKLSFNGKSKEFKAGTPLSKAVAQLGCKVTYSCRK
jgi:hypothetical protein